MVCFGILTKQKYNYRFINDDTVEIWDGWNYTKKISYDKWCQDYFIIDKWRNLSQAEIDINKIRNG